MIRHLYMTRSQSLRRNVIYIIFVVQTAGHHLPVCLPFPFASMWRWWRALEWTLMGCLVIYPSLINLRTPCLLFMLEMFETSWGSNHTLSFPHFRIEAASLFWTLSDTYKFINGVGMLMVSWIIITWHLNPPNTHNHVHINASSLPHTLHHSTIRPSTSPFMINLYSPWFWLSTQVSLRNNDVQVMEWPEEKPHKWLKRQGKRPFVLSGLLPPIMILAGKGFG